MTASPEAKFAPIGAVRGGLVLMVLGALMAWGPVDSIPSWISLGTLFVGGFLVAIALGIRMLRTQPPLLQAASWVRVRVR